LFSRFCFCTILSTWYHHINLFIILIVLS
jgi:hypothetical protein